MVIIEFIDICMFVPVFDIGLKIVYHIFNNRNKTIVPITAPGPKIGVMSINIFLIYSSNLFFYNFKNIL